MFSGPDCPCTPAFRIETANGKLFEGSEISIANNNLELDTAQPASFDLNLRAFFQNDCSTIVPQLVPIKVDICGPIAPKQPMTKQFKLGADLQDLSVPLAELEQMFENPCQMSFSFSTESRDLQVSFDAKAGLVIKNLNRVPWSQNNKVSVNIQATTIGEFQAQNQIVVELVYPDVSAPLFIEPLRNLTIMVDHQKETNLSAFVFKSPKAIDFQLDPITMSELAIDPMPGCNCFNLSQNSDLTFSL